MIRPELLSRLCHARDLLRDWEDDPLPVSAVARASGLTRFHFIRLFKAIFGETPHQYRLRAQIEKAKELLILTDLSVTDIAWQSVSRVSAASALFFRTVLACRRRNFNDGTGQHHYRNRSCPPA
jgi:AraC-like DNA-binding protein